MRRIGKFVSFLKFSSAYGFNGDEKWAQFLYCHVNPDARGGEFDSCNAPLALKWC